jgi:hypothetical protein
MLNRKWFHSFIIFFVSYARANIVIITKNKMGATTQEYNISLGTVFMLQNFNYILPICMAYNASVRWSWWFVEWDPQQM